MDQYRRIQLLVAARMEQATNPYRTSVGTANAVYARRAVTSVALGQWSAFALFSRAVYRLVQGLMSGTTTGPTDGETSIANLRMEVELATAAVMRATPSEEPINPYTQADVSSGKVKLWPEEVFPLRMPPKQYRPDRIIGEAIKVEKDAELERALRAYKQGWDRFMAYRIDHEWDHLEERFAKFPDREVGPLRAPRDSVTSASRGMQAGQMIADRTTIGYARVSTTGRPCSFCAMLISRGPVYKSVESGFYKSSPSEPGLKEKYHDDCKCQIYPVHNQDQWESVPRFEMSKDLQRLWSDTITNKRQDYASYSEMMSAWRAATKEYFGS